MKYLKCALYAGWVLALLFVLSVSPSTVWSAEKENHCFTCHTDARKLIEITRGIAAANKGKPGASAETEGEG